MKPLWNIIILFLFTTEFSPAPGQRRSILFRRRFVYRQYPRIVYHIENDPRQVKPNNKVTRDNMFAWLNPKNYVRFHLWSRDNPHLAHEIKVNDMESLKTSSFNPKRLTKFIIHGYQDNANEVSVGDWIIFMKNAYLELGDVNVIAVDYSFYAITPFYLMPIHEMVAEKLKDLIEFLVKDGADLNAIHLIGWSWGAHVSGLAGQALNGKLGRITGLDPAGPTFKFVGNEFRLDKTDAKFVDVIHTNAGTRLFWGGHFGLKDPIGHVDIYPNGGERQIGCPMEHTLNAESLLCSHGRAGRYFTESITSPIAFPMCPCDNFDKFVRGECNCSKTDVAYLGEHMSHKTRGIFYIITRSHKPYGHGPQLTVTTTSNSTLGDTGEVKKDTTVGRVSSDSFSVTYKNKTTTLKFKNNYRAGLYPNDDILKLTLNVYDSIIMGNISSADST